MKIFYLLISIHLFDFNWILTSRIVNMKGNVSVIKCYDILARSCHVTVEDGLILRKSYLLNLNDQW